MGSESVACHDAGSGPGKCAKDEKASAGQHRYVIVSACRNEGQYVEGLIETVAAQTLQPFRWVIVDDGSTDDTYARAARRGKDLAFLQVVKMTEGRRRSFASKVYAENYGYDSVRHLAFDFIGFLDADIRLDMEYYKEVVGLFHSDPYLGLAGGAVIDQYPDRTENPRSGSEEVHVAGGVQFFRRAAFDQIGGYVPIEGGAEDTVADFMSMMHGWRVRTVPDIKATHLRPEGFSKEGAFRRGIAWGKRFYAIGYHPLFYFGQCVRRIRRRPMLVGSVCQLIGFLVASWRAEPRPVPVAFVQFLRREQRRRLRAVLRSGPERVTRPVRSAMVQTFRVSAGCERRGDCRQ